MLTDRTGPHLADIQSTFVTRRVPVADIGGIDADAANLNPHDVVVAKVDKIGRHGQIEIPGGTRIRLQVNDRLLLACGARDGVRGFRAAAASTSGPAVLAAAGGVAGYMDAEERGRTRAPTEITIQGAAVRTDGSRITLGQYAVPQGSATSPTPVVAIVDMIPGAKSALRKRARALIRDFAAQNLRVAYVKATGSGTDGWLSDLRDRLAFDALNFTDAGLASTYHEPVDRIEAAALNLVDHAARQGADVILLDMANGISQPENTALLHAPRLQAAIRSVILHADDPDAAYIGIDWLRARNHRVGAVSTSNLRAFCRQSVRPRIGMPVLAEQTLQDAQVLQRLTAPA